MSSQIQKENKVMIILVMLPLIIIQVDKEDLETSIFQAASQIYLRTFLVKALAVELAEDLEDQTTEVQI